MPQPVILKWASKLLELGARSKVLVLPLLAERVLDMDDWEPPAMVYVVSPSANDDLGLTAALNSQKFLVSAGWSLFLTEEEWASEKFHSNDFASLILGRSLTKGEVGCALAHRNIYSDFLEGNAKTAIVFEDDALVDAEILQILGPKIHAELLSKNGPKVCVLGGPRGPLESVTRHQMFQRLRYIPTRTFAYAINREAARQLLSSERVDMTADWPTAAIGIQFVSSSVPVAWHDGRLPSRVDANSIQRRGHLDQNRKSLVTRVMLMRSLRELRIFWSFVVARGIGLNRQVNRGRAIRIRGGDGWS